MISNMVAAPQDVVASSGRLIAQCNLARQPELLSRSRLVLDDAMTNDSTLDAHKQRSRAWFEALRDDLCAAFEGLEADLPAGSPHGGQAPDRFVRKAWSRTDAGG